MTDDERDDEAPEPEAGDAPPPDDAPPPATWAGRQSQSLPEAGEGGDEGTGLTEEFNELERDVSDDLDTELAGEYEAPELEADEEAVEAEDPHADEGAEPGDEFELAGDEEPELGEDSDEGEALAAGAGTAEADTLTAADAEEAREAALEGLRNRTAEHAAKRGITDPGLAPVPAVAAEDESAEDGAAAEEAEEAAEPATAVAAAAAPEAQGPAAEKPPRAGVWARFMAASFLIIASMATATSVSLLVYLTDIAKGLGGLGGLSGKLDEIDANAQNFLIIGSDVRPGQESHGLSDTTMLLRVDPDANQITQLSIPRDLRVNIPGHGIDKFNAAYSYGGPTLTLEVVKQITGDIPINHVVNIDFHGFADAVDAIGCVYVDVDHHYFHTNEGLSSIDQYSEIDIEAGYQRLCGFKALQYVRYRHEDNDIVRAARQQGFLREARQKVPPSKLLDDRNELIDIFKNYTTSDIDDTSTLITLFKLMLDARDAQITQIQFPFDSLDDEGYVTASDEPLKQAVSQFLGESSPPQPPSDEGGDGNGGSKPKDKGKENDKSEPKPETPPPVDLIDATVSGSQYAAAILEAGGKDLKFPVLYPTKLPPQSGIAEDTRYFGVDAGNGDLRHGYKFVITYPGTTYPTAYYGVSGTDWLDAPLFADPSETRKIGEREYSFYYDGDKLRMLAFRRDNAWYWVTNTLDKLLTEPQMIAIAQNLSEAGT